MLTTFTILNALSESANGFSSQSIGSIPAHPFTGLELTEAIGEGIQLVMDEAACYTEFSVAADELMVEAAITNPGAMDALSENIFATIAAGAKKFFDNLVKVVKGIIEKIKAFFAKFAGKTDKWVSIMKPKIAAADRRPGNKELTAEMHEWNVEYITSGIQHGVSELFSVWKKDITPEEYSAFVEGIKNESKKFVDMDANKFKTEQITSGSNGTDARNEKIANIGEDVLKALCEKLGVDGTDLPSAYAAIRKKANGGDKVTVKYGSMTGFMLDAVEASKKTINAMEKSYNNYLKDLTKYKNATDKTSDIKLEDESKMPQGAAATLREKLRAEINYVVKTTSAYHGAIDSVRQINTGLVSDMTNEYISVLTKYSGAKVPKDN